MAQGKVEICGVNTAKLPVLGEKEKEELFARIKKGDEQAKEEYIKGNLRLVLSVIKRFGASNENPDDLFPTIYRIDRIQTYQITDESFSIPYRDRFEEGEFRKRIPFMYGGKLQKKQFLYTGPDINAVLDRLPTAKAVKQKDGSYLVDVEVFGSIGLTMWLNSQGDYVRVLS